MAQYQGSLVAQSHGTVVAYSHGMMVQVQYHGMTVAVDVCCHVVNDAVEDCCHNIPGGHGGGDCCHGKSDGVEAYWCDDVLLVVKDCHDRLHCVDVAMRLSLYSCRMDLEAADGHLAETRCEMTRLIVLLYDEPEYS